jgi:hypothetical protein
MKPNYKVFIYPEEFVGKVQTYESLKYSFSSLTNEIYVKDSVLCDYEMIANSLSLSHARDYVIVCKSTSMCLMSPEDLSRVVNEVVERNTFDIFYLSKWLDRCDLYGDVKDIKSVKFKIRSVKTLSPNGLNCFILSPSGRDKFLSLTEPRDEKSMNRVFNSMIHGDSEIPLRAYTTTPSLFSYDIIAGRGEDANFYKTCECRIEPIAIKKEKNRITSSMYFFWFLVIFILTFITVFFTFYYSRELTLHRLFRSN